MDQKVAMISPIPHISWVLRHETQGSVQRKRKQPSLCTSSAPNAPISVPVFYRASWLHSGVQPLPSANHLQLRNNRLITETVTVLKKEMAQLTSQAPPIWYIIAFTTQPTDCETVPFELNDFIHKLSEFILWGSELQNRLQLQMFPGNQRALHQSLETLKPVKHQHYLWWQNPKWA